MERPWLTRKPSEVITKISLIEVPYEHREKIIPSWLCVSISMIRLFPEANHVGDNLFRTKHEIILENKYFNVLKYKYRYFSL